MPHEDKHTEGGIIFYKMQADQKPVIWTVVIATLVLLVAGLIGGSVVNTNLKLTADALGDISVDVDEQAIVNAIMAGIVMPEWTAPEMPDTAKLNELWDAEYSYEVSLLKNDSEIEAIKQFKEDNDEFSDDSADVVALIADDYEAGYYFFEGDDIYDLVTEGVDCDGDCVVMYVKEYDADDRDIEVLNLGLDDEDDREVTLSTRIRVKVFTDEDDDEEYFFERVDINSVVTSDGELEAEVTYSL